MFKKLAAIVALTLSCQSVMAQDETFYQPAYEAEVFYSNLTVKDESLEAEEVPDPKGNGGGVRLSALLNETFQATAEVSVAKPDVRGDGGRAEFELQQYRIGIRAIEAGKSGSPVYASAGLELGHFIADAKIDFDADTGEPDIDFESEDYTLGIGHLRAGYRTQGTHIYADVAYGLGGDEKLLEFLGGASFRVIQNFSLFGEYRYSQFDIDGFETDFQDIRVGVGATF